MPTSVRNRSAGKPAMICLGRHAGDERADEEGADEGDHAHVDRAAPWRGRTSPPARRSISAWRSCRLVSVSPGNGRPGAGRPFLVRPEGIGPDRVDQSSWESNVYGRRKVRAPLPGRARPDGEAPGVQVSRRGRHAADRRQRQQVGVALAAAQQAQADRLAHRVARLQRDQLHPVGGNTSRTRPGSSVQPTPPPTRFMSEKMSPTSASPPRAHSRRRRTPRRSRRRWRSPRSG